MTTIPSASTRSSAPGSGPTLSRATHSELIKLRSLRAHVVLLGTGALFLLALGPIQAIGQVLSKAEPEPLGTVSAAISVALTGGTTTALLVGVLGVLSVTSEFPTALIRTTLWAVPRRGLAVTGKVAALLTLLVPTIVLSTVIALEATRQVLARADHPMPELSWSQPSVWWSLLAMTLFATGWALLGQALGWLLRSAVGAAFALLGLMFALPLVVLALPSGVEHRVWPYLLSEAGSSMMRLQEGNPAGLAPGPAALVWLGWIVVGLLLATWAMKRRDA